MIYRYHFMVLTVFLLLAGPGQAAPIINNFAGTGNPNPSNPDYSGPSQQAVLNYPMDVAVDSQGNIYIAELYSVRKVDARTGNMISVFDLGSVAQPQALALDSHGVLYVLSGINIYKINPGTIRNSNIIPDISLPYSAKDLAVDSTGNLYITGYSNNQLVRIQPNGSRVPMTYCNSGSAPLYLCLDVPIGIVIDSRDNIYVAENGGHKRIIKFTPDGTNYTVLTSAGTNGPNRLALNTSDTLYFTAGQQIFYLAPGNETPAAVANTNPSSGYEAGNTCRQTDWGDGGLVADAVLYRPQGLAFDAAGNLYVADKGHCRVRVISGLQESTPSQQNTPPVAAFTMSSNPDFSGLVEVDAATSSDAENNIAAYQWKAGDISFVTRPPQTTAAFDLEPGDYVITLTVVDSENLRDSTQQSVSIAVPALPEPPDAAASVVLKDDLSLEIPRILYSAQTGTSQLWARLRYAPLNGRMIWEVADYDFLPNTCCAVRSASNAVTLDANWRLTIPALTFQGSRFSAVLVLRPELGGLRFELESYQDISQNPMSTEPTVDWGKRLLPMPGFLAEPNGVMPRQ